MAEITAAMMSSHAYTFLDPEQWDARRQVTRQNYASRYGVLPDERPEVGSASPEDDERRYRGIRAALDELRSRLAACRPDVLIVIGDDQDENFKLELQPQFAVFVGDDFGVVHRGSTERLEYAGAPDLGRHVLRSCVDAGFDLASSARLGDDNRLISHAHREPLAEIDPEGAMTVLPLFVNAIHEPAPSPRRCYEMGQALRAALDSFDEGLRVAMYASGGLSHFTAGYPWQHYVGPHTLGSIDVEFDVHITDAIRDGKGSTLADLTSADLLAHGDIELRQAIVLLGAIGDVVPEFLCYEPFPRAVMGMAVGFWDLGQ